MGARTFLLTAFSVIGFGIWGFLMKMGQERLGGMPHLVTMGLVIALIVLIGLLTRQATLPPVTAALWIPVAATIAATAGTMFLVRALEASQGNPTAVVALAALYPGVTAVCSAIFLGESFGLTKIAALFTAFLAAFLFAR